MEVLFHQRWSLQNTVLCHVQTCHSDRRFLEHLPPLPRIWGVYCLGHGTWRSCPTRSVRVVHIGGICCTWFFFHSFAVTLLRNGLTLCYGGTSRVVWMRLRVVSKSTGVHVYTSFCIVSSGWGPCFLFLGPVRVPSRWRVGRWRGERRSMVMGMVWFLPILGRDLILSLSLFHPPFERGRWCFGARIDATWDGPKEPQPLPSNTSLPNTARHPIGCATTRVDAPTPRQERGRHRAMAIDSTEGD